MRAFNLFVIHGNDTVKRDLVHKMCTNLDPDPHWDYPTTAYTGEQFLPFYDQSILIDEDADWTDDNLADRAYGYYAACSQGFYDNILLWGAAENDALFEAAMGVTSAELTTLKAICTWVQVETYDASILAHPCEPIAQSNGYDLEVNYDPVWLQAKKDELGYEG